MTIKVAINGFGRIGRTVLRAHYENKKKHDLEIIAINGSGNAKDNSHLLKYDSTHGKFNAEISSKENFIFINNDKIEFLNKKDPKNLPSWKAMGVDLVLECTGRFTSRDDALLHINAGAKKVLISGPGYSPGTGKEADATIVYGVNHKLLNKNHKIVSNASCTTNCLAPIAKVLSDKLGIESGIMNTIHAYTNDQVLNDAYHNDLRRARAAALSMIPTKTGAATSIGLVIPELDGILDGLSVRVPTNNVSLVDLTFMAKKKTSVKEINEIINVAANTDYLNIIQFNTEPLVSIDFNHNPYSSIFDSTQTRVSSDGRLVKVLAWYDNEWGFSNRMLDTSIALMKA
jgi:glyceraldehyde 3-phosphate dehydrogenase